MADHLTLVIQDGGQASAAAGHVRFGRGLEGVPPLLLAKPVRSLAAGKAARATRAVASGTGGTGRCGRSDMACLQGGWPAYQPVDEIGSG